MQTQRILPIIAFLGFASIIDTSMISPIISTYASQLGASSAIAGFIAGLYSIIAIFVSFPLGYLVDRIGRRKALMIAIPGDIIAFLIYFLAFNYSLLIIARSIHAFFDSIIFPSAIAIIGDQFRKRGYPLSLFYSLISISVVIGALLSSFTTLYLGFRYVFVILILIHLITFYLIYAQRIKEVAGFRLPDSVRQVKLNSKLLIPAFLTMFSVYLFNGVITGSLGLTLQQLLNLKKETAGAYVGIFLTISGLVGIPAYFLSSYICERKNPLISLLIASIIGLIANLVMITNINLYLIVASPIWGIALGFAFLTSSYIVSSVGQEGRGTASGILQIFTLAGVAIGASFSGILLNFGIFYPYLLSLAALVISSILTLTFMLALRLQ